MSPMSPIVSQFISAAGVARVLEVSEDRFCVTLVTSPDGPELPSVLPSGRPQLWASVEDARSHAQRLVTRRPV